MKSEFRATSPEDRDRIAVFLKQVFKEDVASALTERRNMEWKYWIPRFDWEGSRGFLLERKGEITAHAGVWPIELCSESRSWKAIHLIDWAAGEQNVGAGVVLLQRLARSADVVVAIGGSGKTRQIMPALGFREVCTYRIFARPVRPFQQALAHQYRNWKLPMRWLRNSMWGVIPGGKLPEGWSAEAVSPQALSALVLPRASAQLILGSRRPELFAYLRECPCARFELFQLRKGNEVAGYVCIGFVPGIARIADLWVRSTNPDDWTAAYCLAMNLARAKKDVLEVQAASSFQLGAGALLRAGLRERAAMPVFLLDAKQSLPAGREFSFQMIDYDGAFARDDRPAFLC